ncbi:MAG: hypothetical protein IT177_07760 [Acidobacteria bacterium]|nr:hypothetical protein [Acidobacteriota bacterium]
MTEPQARQAGHRPAYGRPCGPVDTGTSAPSESTAPRQAVTSPAPTASPESAAAVRVWVNTSSGVYHCAGTRYYGKTARGTYMREGEARQQGHRPAGGRACGPVSNVAPSDSVTAPAARAVPPPAAAATATTPTASGVRVWVNTGSGVYHCPGTRYYGNTKAGTYMTESEARAAGHRPAGGRACR